MTEASGIGLFMFGISVQAPLHFPCFSLHLHGFHRYRCREGGGAGGTDSQFIPMMATPGERVTVETPAQQRDVIVSIINRAMNERGRRALV